MAKQIVPDTAKFTLVLSRSGDYEIDNSIYIRNTVTGWSGAQLVNTAGDIETWWDDECKPLVNAAYTLARIEYEDLGADPGVSGFTSPAIVGTRAGSVLPGVVAAYVRIAGDGGSLPKKGANYFVGGSEADGDSSNWTDAYCDALEDAYSELPDAVNNTVAGNALVIVSRFLNGEKRDEGVTNTVADFAVRQTFSVQKRRRPHTSIYRT
jgi:hypothetical protein